MKTLFAVMFGAGALALAAGENLLKNPELAGTPVPAGWKHYDTGLPVPQVVKAPDGKPALLLADDAPDRGGGLTQTIACEPGAKYEFSCTVLAVPGKSMDRAAIQADGKNMTLVPGKNVLGVTPAKKRMTIFVWTPKADTGHAYLRDLRLEKVTEFGSGTCVDGKRKKAVKPAAAKSAAAVSKKPSGIPVSGDTAVFEIKTPGIYQIDAEVSSPVHPVKLSFVDLSVDGRPWTRSALRNYNPMDHTRALLLFERFAPGKHTIKFNTYDKYLKDQVKIHSFLIYPCRECRVPAAAKTFVPPIVPPPTRPRILITQATLPKVRANLAKEPNASVWKKLKQEADRERIVKAPEGRALGYNALLCRNIRAKFFAYQMTGDRKYAESGKKVLLDYMHKLDFVHDWFYVRYYGELMYTTALAYDWGYDFFTADERAFLRERMDFFAHTQEVGYPPFAQPITIGHGNERQIQIDYMAMAVAVYDENPEFYRYGSYRLLGVLMPERVREFESGRHNEGAAYGQFRLGYDLYTALNFKTLNGGKTVFPETIRDVYTHWLYTRMPDGTLFNDGDCYSFTLSGYCAALAAAYTGNPYYAGVLQDADGLANIGDAEQMLAWYDPDLKPESDLSSLPLTRYQCGVLSSMNCRTGWNMGIFANDALVEFNAKEFFLGSHSHRDAGSFQIAYRGMLAGDIGQYRIFGVPYDAGFAKRTVAHSAMLVHNPQETMTHGNDGGQRPGYTFAQLSDFDKPERRSAVTLAADCGPDAKLPLYSVLKTDLTKAYPEGRLAKHVRSFYFLNFCDPERPGAVLVADRAESKFDKYFQINSPGVPELTADGVKLTSCGKSAVPGYLFIRMLRPAVKPELLTGKAAYNVFGKQYKPAYPDRPANRTLFPARNGEKDFTCMMQITAKQPLPVTGTAAGPVYTVRIKDWTLVISNDGDLIRQPFTVEASGYTLLADLAPGDWTVEGKGFVTVTAGKHTAFLRLAPGKYTVRPGRSGNPIPAVKNQAVPTPAVRNTVLIDGKVLPGITPVLKNHHLYLAAEPAARALGKTWPVTSVRFQPDSITVSGKKLYAASHLGAVLNVHTVTDPERGSVLFDTKTPAASVIPVASSNGKPAAGLFDGSARWSHNSNKAFFTVYFLHAPVIKGLDIAFNSSSVPMQIEASPDGKNWTCIDRRVSLPRNGSVTQVRFAKPLKAEFLRFKFEGSRDNPNWNALNRITPVF